jgi:putative ATP-grasp target RiPP
MTDHVFPLWRDPLFSPGDRFPLGPPPEFWSDSQDEPSAVGTRPYSLRGVVPAAKSDVAPDVTYTYDPLRQIGLVRGVDGTVVPLSKHTQPGPTPGGTSFIGDSDPKNPPPEEMNPNDYQTD